MKRSKNKLQRNKKIVFLVIILAFALLVGMSYGLVKVLNRSYKAEARSSEIKRYNESQKNKEIQAGYWLRVQGTNIDYPVINGRMDYTSLDEVKGDYLWMLGSADEIPNKMLILGHNILNVSAHPKIADKSHTRFEQLPSFLYYDFVEENKYIQLTFENDNYLYKIFSVAVVKDDELDYVSDNYSEQDLEEYIEKSLDESIYDFDVKVDKTDKIISLVTCTRIYGASSEYDLRIDARMVRKRETTNNYKVSKNKKYEKIEEAMRGEDNEEV